MKFGLSYLLADDMPDLVISGSNHGFNLGSDVLYSGNRICNHGKCIFMESLALLYL